ncbi:MAG: Verru Chthon cassette protein [Verrucomicrobiota bacterium]|jgi:uncharacterized protein (TIGR02596 family)
MTRPFCFQSTSNRQRAFTLVEMLTVVGIIALLVALMTPALVDVIRATRLNSAGDGLQNRLSLAQQSAVSRSTEVEMRFYKYTDADSSNPSAELFYAYQVVETPNGTDAKALSEVYYLDSGIIISDKEEWSPLLATTIKQQADSNNNYLFEPSSGAGGSNVEYAALRFYPDGSCKLLNTDNAAAITTLTGAAFAYTIPPLPVSFLTVIEDRHSLANTLPDNYYCMQIDAYTGKVRVYRP